MTFRALLSTVLVCAASPVAAQQVITTVAGTQWLFPHEPRPAIDAPVGGTLLMGVASDPNGNFYIADSDNHMVMKVRPDGVLEPFAGNGLEFFSGEGDRAVDAGLLLPVSVAVDTRGNVYIGEFSGRIRRVSPEGLIYSVAGTGEQGFTGDGGLASQAKIGSPRGLAFDLAGNLYFADSYAHAVRKISPEGIITTVAGNGTPGWSGDGGLATKAQLNEPGGVALDEYGNIYIADTKNAVVRAVTTGGIILTIAGGYGYSTEDGANALNSIILPMAVAIDQGYLYVADALSHRVFRFGGDLIVHNVAGGNEEGFSGDGGPALKAQLNYPTGIALDPNGNLLIAERGNSRVRRVSTDGIIRTVAGNGRFRTGGDGGPATSAALYLPVDVTADPRGNLYIAEQLHNRVRRVTPQGRIDTFAGAEAGLRGPYGVASDAMGNIFITDNFNNLIRKVTPDGNMSTIAGTLLGDPGEGVEAPKAKIHDPRHIAVDRSGNLYYAEGFGNRVRKISATGIVTTIAGTGEAGFSGDGGPARQARLNQPIGVAVDAEGNVYISDYNNHRVRKVTASGIITTLAGTGRAEFSGDGGPAAQASLRQPTGLEVDAGGNLYIADEFNYRVRKVSPAGLITTVAGSGNPGFRGDGGLATDAWFLAPSAVALDASGTLYIADWNNHRIRAVLTQRPTFDADRVSLQFRGKSGGLPSASQPVQVTGSITGVMFTISTSGAGWLKTSTQAAVTPGLLEVSADPEGLAPGEYTETLTLTAPNALSPVRTIPVRFTVEAADPPRLVARSDSLTFLVQQRGSPATQTLLVANEGGGAVEFRASSSVPWLQVSPDQSTVTARTGAAVEVIANPAGLAAGTYTGAVLLTTADRVVSVPVTLLVRSIPQTISLGEVGLTFTAVTGGGVTPARTVGVGNAGEGVMPWRARPVTLSGGGQWLRASPEQGSSSAGGELAEVTVAVDPSGLEPGQYHGRVEILADGADNSPQAIAVILNVLPAGSDPGPIVQPSALIFRGVQGSVSPVAQYVFVSNLAASPVSFRSGRLSEAGTPWFQYGPLDATVSRERSIRMVVQPDISGLDAGVHRATLTLLFDSGVRRTVQLVFVVLPRVGGGRSLRRALEDCRPTRLVPVFTALPESFQAPAGWPQELEVRVVDDCAAPMTTGSTVASFSNGDVPIMLQPLRDGRWTGTWQSRRAAASSVTVTVQAEMPDRNLRGAASVTGGVQGTQTGPVLRASPAVNAASLRPELPLAPGMLVSIFGSNLGNTASAQGYPWPTELGGTTVVMSGRSLPLLEVAPDRIEAVVPYDVPVNARQQLLVQRGSAMAVPEPVTVSPAQPAVYTKDRSGSGQGMIHVVADAGELRLAEPGTPAHAGDTVVITCTGLGAVDPALPAGSATPQESPRVLAPVSVTIGGVEATVVSARLVSGATGLYEVHARVPQGVAGESAPVVVTVGTESSPPVTMAVE